MAKYRNRLPQLQGRPFVTDGGLETTLIFHEGLELPCFAAFDLLKDAAGTARLRRYFEPYIAIAQTRGCGMVLEAPTWRANPDWGARLGYDAAALATANRQAIDLLVGLRAQYETASSPMVISGNLGPRGDGYRVEARMSADAARAYHAPQVEVFAGTEADLVSAFTMTYSQEAIGIVQAARDAALPVVIAFTVETDGRLPSGETLADAIEQLDAHTGGHAAYCMVNCAHPTHFAHALEEAGAWRERIGGLRANASCRSHAELDESTDLDDGNPAQLGAEYAALKSLLPRLTVLGGCCGTDHRHVQAMVTACA